MLLPIVSAAVGVALAWFIGTRGTVERRVVAFWFNRSATIRALYVVIAGRRVDLNAPLAVLFLALLIIGNHAAGFGQGPTPSLIVRLLRNPLTIPFAGWVIGMLLAERRASRAPRDVGTPLGN